MDRRRVLDALLGLGVLLSTPAGMPAQAEAVDAEDLPGRVKALLLRLKAPLLRRFLDRWPESPVTRSATATSLPVLQWLPDLPALAPPLTGEVVNLACAQAARLEWRRTYAQPDVSRAFLEGYGWTELIGLRGALQSERLACGLLLLGPHVSYPPHRHEAEEVYVPLAGTARWQQGDGVWRERVAGTVIHHASGEPHAMQTRGEPLLALYLWRSDNLAQKARLDVAVPGS